MDVLKELSEHIAQEQGCSTITLPTALVERLQLEITQLRAVAGLARGTDEGSLAAIRRDMEHG